MLLPDCLIDLGRELAFPLYDEAELGFTRGEAVTLEQVTEKLLTCAQRCRPALVGDE